MRTVFDKSKELLLWGPIPGRWYYVSIFFDKIFNHLPVEYPQAYWPPVLFLFRNKRMVWINQMEDAIHYGAECFKTYMLPDKERQQMYALWIDSIKRSEAIFEKIGQAGKLDDESFLKLYDEFHEEYNEFWLRSVPPELGNYGSPELLRQALQPVVPAEEIDHAMEVLTAPLAPSFYQEEEFDLVKTDNLQEHAKQYFWLQHSYAGVKESTVEFFAQKKQALSPNVEDEVYEKLSEARRRKEELAKKYRLSEDIVHLAQVIADNVVWQDQRKKHIFIRVHYQDLLVKEVSRRTGRAVDDLVDLDCREVPGLLRGEHFDFAKRKQGFGMDSQDQETYIDAAETKRLWDYYTTADVAADAKEVKGIIASKGKVQGKVHVYLDPSKDFPEGHILVTSMTAPEYIFAMKKAAGIVTNSGGLTSHAAIVSRELGKPCIVGAKGVLQVFKDDDLVEVDAFKGVVRRLS